jgi:hypothetical protein
VFAGNGLVFSNLQLSFGGDGGPALNATFSTSLVGLVYDRTRRSYLIGDNRRIRSISEDGRLVSTIAGTGTLGLITNFGNGGPAILANLNAVSSIALSPEGDTLFILENPLRMRSMSLVTGMIEHLAGTGVSGVSPAGTLAAAAMISPVSIVVRPNDGMIVFGESNMIRGISPVTKTIVNLYGTGLPEAAGDGGSAENCSFFSISGLAYLGGDLFVGGGTSTTVRVISSSTGIISLVTSGKPPSETSSGSSSPVFSSQNGIATSKNGDVYFFCNNFCKILSNNLYYFL